MSLPPEVPAPERLIQRLEERFPALRHLRDRGGWIVGGAVRDLLLGRESDDVDLVFEGAAGIATSFADAAGRRRIVLGRPGVEAHRVTVGDRKYDFAELTRGSIEGDLSRRDFTINAIAVRIDRPIVLDPHHGIDDLRAQHVRQIDEQNFVDDPLRILKAVRMAVTLQFTIEEETLLSLRRHSRLLAKVPAERVTAELRLIAAGDAASSLSFLRATSLLDVLELAPSEGCAERLRRLGGADEVTALAAILCDFEPSAVLRFAERWKLSAVERASLVMQNSLYHRASSGRTQDDCHLRVAVRDAGPVEATRFARIAEAASLPQAREWSAIVARDLDFLSSCDGFLDGDELRERFGLKGKRIGEWKRRLLIRQICGLTKDREAALRFVEEKLGSELDVDAAEADGNVDR